MTNTYNNLEMRRLLLLLAFIFSLSSGFAQLTGAKSIPGDYATLELAIADLNTQGVGSGGVTFNLLPGNPQTAPAGGYAITTSGSLTDAIVFNGNANVITASASLTAGLLYDAIIKIIGTDNVTIQDFTLEENAANTITTAGSNNMTEWGIALLYASTTNGSLNCSLINNTIALNRTYQNTFGIYANSTHAATTIGTSATATTADGGTSGLIIQSNDISNVNMGIVVVGPTGAADHNNGIDIGGTSIATGNIITNFGTTNAISSYANVSGTVNGILIRNSKNANVSYNTLTSSNGGITVGTLNGIQQPAFSNAPIGTFTQTFNNNQISLNSGVTAGAINGINIAGTSATTTSTININNNDFSNTDHTTGTASGAITLITQGGTHQFQNINNNTFTNLNVKTTGSVTFIINSHTLPANGVKNVNGNSIVTAFNKSGAGGTVTLFSDNGSDPGTATNNTNNNNFSNITVTGATTIAGFLNTNGGSPIKSVANNTFSNWIGGTSAITGLTVSFSGSSTITNNVVSNITSAGAITGISTGSGIENFSGNIVHTLNSTGASVVNGIANTGGTTKVFDSNKIYNLEANNAGGSVNGINISGGTDVTLLNNVIGDLRAPSSNAANPLNGININGGTAVKAYYNSVYLNATSAGAVFGSSAISSTTGVNLTLANNIFINESTANSTGFTVAYRRSSTTLTSYNNASNRNLFYAGVSSASNLIMFDGTNPYPTIIAYQIAVNPRDLNSFTGEAFTYSAPGSFFTSLTGSSTDFLRPVAGISSQVESGAINITTPLITDDFSGVIRAGNIGYLGTGTNPDLGAYEFEGISPSPVITLNSVTPSTTTQCVAAARLISTNITTASGTITSANIGYSINGVPQAAIPMVNTSGSTWEATIPVPTPSNADIVWGVTGTNSIGLNSFYSGTSYSDEPLTGVVANATISDNEVCAGNPTSLSATLNLNGNITVGNGTGTTGATEELTAFSNRRVTYRQQSVYTAADLTASGLSAGSITSIGYTIATVGDAANTSNFTVLIGNTGLTALTDYVPSGSFTVCRPAATYNHAVGLNVINLSTPFVWDGVSNIIIEVSHGGIDNINNAQTFYTTTASNTTVYGFNGAVVGTTSNKRFNTTFFGNTSPSISSVTWMDGMTNLGTGNPLIVNPTTSTTYTANITAEGCVVSPSPTVDVTVNVLPTAPTALNSAQCGTQIPTASVASTSGLPTPTFIWYDAAVAGTELQNSSSTTFTSNVASTTTFYVSEVNATTLCESPRTAVTVTVATADEITAGANNTSICIGSSVEVNVENDNGTPNQTYSYTWTNAETGSGLVSQIGATVIITPTQVGTYTYDVTGVDGGCSAVSSIEVTVNPYTASLTPIHLTCNGSNDGSFEIATETCGTASTYSVNSGAFGAIPTNLTAGTYDVVVENSLGYQSGIISITINEPAAIIPPVGIENIEICQNATSAELIVPTIATINNTISFELLAQPAVIGTTAIPTTTTATPNIIASAVLPSLPAGAVITNVTFTMAGLDPLGGSWASDVYFGFSGDFTANYTGGVGAPNNANVFDYTGNFTTGTYNPAGGTVSLHYYDRYDDVAGAECVFPTGPNAGTLNVTYTVTNPSIAWYDASSAGNLLGSGTPFETVGTTLLPNTNVPGDYSFYAAGVDGVCSSATRSLVTVTVLANTSSTTTISECISYTWTDANTYFTSGTYTQLLENANGCDSIATLELTINNPSPATDVQTACDSYTWIDGNTYFTNENTATFMLQTVGGCDSLVTLDLTITETPVAIATDNEDATLTASAGSNYQWIDCGTGLPIDGANAQTFTVIVSGSYAVTVSNGDCENTSDCVIVDFSGINEISKDNISVFPNPTLGLVKVNMSTSNALVEVIDAQGKILQTTNVENEGTINLSSYESGIYIFRINTENGVSIHRVSKN